MTTRAALALALALALAATSARADPEEDQVAALLAADDARAALPVALARARRLGADVAAWARALTIAGWTSDQAAALEALRRLVALRPDDRDRRLALAQRLLWARATREALPHARWLLARPAERDPVALEVATWVLQAEGDADGARAAVARWVAATGDPRARQVLADMTHWSARWREAAAQYDALVRVPSAAARARARIERLRHDHPSELRLDGVWWSDNVGVTYEALALEGTVQRPWRLAVTPRAEVGRWRLARDARDESLGVVTTQARVRAELWNDVWPEALLGVEADTAGNVAPFAHAGVRLSVRGWLFGRVWVQHDRHRVSLDAARQDVRAAGPAWSLYAEPARWLFVASDAAVHWISDGNLRGRALVAVGAHNPHALQVEPRAYVQFDGYRDLREGAVPYFTPTAPWSVGGDVTVRYTRGDAFRVEAGIGVVVQDGVVAWRPSGSARVELARHLRASVAAGYVGSPQYNQTRVDATLGWLF